MRPTPIPGAEVFAEHRRIVMAPPDGDLTRGDILPVELLVGADEHGDPVFRARIVLEDDDLERLQAGEAFWVSFMGHVVPFSVGFLTDPPATS